MPERSQLVTHASELEARGQGAIMKLQDVADLAVLRLRVEQNRARLEQRKEERRDLQAILDQIRAQSKLN